MNVRYCASVSVIQNARKWPSIIAQYGACVVSRKEKKDTKLYIAKSSLNVVSTITAVMMVYEVSSCAHYQSQNPRS